MIVVTGANGQLGRLVVEQLLARVPAQQIGVSVREPERAQGLAARGVRVRHGDFTDGQSLTQAFAGASQLLLVSSDSMARGGDPLLEHRTAIEAARAAGVRRVLYTSHMAASPSSVFPPTVVHAATELMLRESGLLWTALRNGFYASNALLVLGRAVTSGVLEAPLDGKVAWTAHLDLAEAAAVVLADEGCFDGPTPSLTSGEAFDYAELCEFVSELRKQPLRRSLISEEQLRTNLAAFGLPASVTEISIGFYRASSDGEFSKVDPTLRNLLKREPTRVQTLLAERLGMT